MAARVNGHSVFVVALTVRLLAVIPATAKVTTYSQGDPIKFANTAAFVASGLRRGVLQYPDVSPTNRMWGGILSPFWLLPGPSDIYARIWLATCGALAVYNVYVIACTYHSRRAGLYAAVPMALLPTHVTLHGTLMRDTLLIFLLTLIARLVIRQPTRHRLAAGIWGALAFAVACILRPDNIGMYVVVIGLGAAIIVGKKIPYREWLAYALPLTLAAIVSSALVGYTLTPRAFSELQSLRMSRAHGSALYLADYQPTGVVESLLATPMLSLLFLVVPLPWMVDSAGAMLASLGGILIFGYAIGTVLTLPYLLNFRHNHTAVPLVAGAVLGVLLYGFVMSNYGAVTRFRQMFTWVFFIGGGIGLARKVTFDVAATEEQTDAKVSST